MLTKNTFLREKSNDHLVPALKSALVFTGHWLRHCERWSRTGVTTGCLQVRMRTVRFTGSGGDRVCAKLRRGVSVRRCINHRHFSAQGQRFTDNIRAALCGTNTYIQYFVCVHLQRPFPSESASQCHCHCSLRSDNNGISGERACFARMLYQYLAVLRARV